MRSVYFDNAATTAPRSEVVDAMHSVLSHHYGNPSSTHTFGRSSRALIEGARKEIAKTLSCKPAEIIFTSGGTEADNCIIRSAVRDLGVKRIITSRIEHHAVLHAVESMADEYQVHIEYVSLDAHGFVDYIDLETLLAASPSTSKTLVSLMHVNNEVGNLLDLHRVGALCAAYGAYFHSDTVQSIGHYTLNLTEIPVHFLAAAAHKFHGPKGIGFMFVRSNCRLKSLIVGGAQERGLRAGTESIHDIVGLETAFKLSYVNLEQEQRYIQSLKELFIRSIQEHIPSAQFNGASSDLNHSTYTLVNLRLPVTGDRATMLLFHLDLHGIACSQGSACQSGSNKGSHVLDAILPDDQKWMPSLRFSFSIYNTTEEVMYAVKVLADFVDQS
ncbi:MAG: hypothetical protein RLZZ242_104 [Bacteroidota bacterium]|jgi:cysteine desulfurase